MYFPLDKLQVVFIFCGNNRCVCTLFQIVKWDYRIWQIMYTSKFSKKSFVDKCTKQSTFNVNNINFVIIDKDIC